jgi:hypothetical protein
MFRIERGRSLSVLLLALALGVGAMTVLPAAAEEIQYYEGEPTDPEKSFLIGVHADDLADRGISQTPPADEADHDAWYRALLDLLRALGLLPTEDSAP